MSPSLWCKVDRVVELRSSPENIFNVFAHKTCDIPTYAPGFIQSVDVHGDTQTWKYTFGGKDEVFKAKVEVDAATHTWTYVATGGHLTEIYKHEKTVFKLTPKGNGSILHLTMEAEKCNVHVLPPHLYIDFIIAFTLMIDGAKKCKNDTAFVLAPH